MNTKQVLNYITIIFAVSTIGMAIYTIKTKENIIMLTVMLIITIVINYISNKQNLKDITLSKTDKNFLDNIKKK